MLNTWNPLPISRIGRINVLKMLVMPKLLYYFEILPVPIPMAQLKLLKRWFLNFIWKDGAHRVASSVIFSRRGQGGMGAPDIHKYYLASYLHVMVSWASMHPPNRWTEMEMGSLLPTHPCSLVWSPALFTDPKLHDLCLGPMLFSLRIWWSCYISSHWHPPAHPFLMCYLTPFYLIVSHTPGCSLGPRRVCSNSDILCTLLPEIFTPSRTYKLKAKKPK